VRDLQAKLTNFEMFKVEESVQKKQFWVQVGGRTRDPWPKHPSNVPFRHGASNFMQMKAKLV